MIFDTEMRAKLLSSLWRDMKRFSTLILACTTILSTYTAVRVAYGDAEDYYAYQGASGPYLASLGPAGEILLGEQQPEYHPGDRVGWTATFCVMQNTAWRGDLSLVHPVAHESKVVAMRTSRFAADDGRCGPKSSTIVIPAGAPPGDYAIRRVVTFREGTSWPVHARLPDMLFTVASEDHEIR